MKRRDFLKTSALAGAALTLNFEGLQAALASNTMAVEAVPDLVAVMGGEPDVMLDKALEALGGISKYVKAKGRHKAQHWMGQDTGNGGQHQPQAGGSLGKEMPRCRSTKGHRV